MKTYNEFGLSEESTKWILRVIQIFPEIEEVIIFGSRAKGNHKPGSDIDFAIKGDFPEFNYPEKLRTSLLLASRQQQPLLPLASLPTALPERFSCTINRYENFVGETPQKQQCCLPDKPP